MLTEGAVLACGEQSVVQAGLGCRVFGVLTWVSQIPFPPTVYVICPYVASLVVVTLFA